jgi:hypothetical protein
MYSGSPSVAPIGGSCVEAPTHRSVQLARVARSIQRTRGNCSLQADARAPPGRPRTAPPMRRCRAADTRAPATRESPVERHEHEARLRAGEVRLACSGVLPISRPTRSPGDSPRDSSTCASWLVRAFASAKLTRSPVSASIHRFESRADLGALGQHLSAVQQHLDVPRVRRLRPAGRGPPRDAQPRAGRQVRAACARRRRVRRSDCRWAGPRWTSAAAPTSRACLRRSAPA